MSGPEWVFYETPTGGTPVTDGIHSVFRGDAGKRGRVILGGLLNRIANGETMPGDVSDLGGGLAEARMTLGGNEYRLLFARRNDGYIALHFVQKKANEITPGIKLARERLAQYHGDV